LRAAEAAELRLNGEKRGKCKENTREMWSVVPLSWRAKRGLGFPLRLLRSHRLRNAAIRKSLPKLVFSVLFEKPARKFLGRNYLGLRNRHPSATHEPKAAPTEQPPCRTPHENRTSTVCDLRCVRPPLNKTPCSEKPNRLPLSKRNVCSYNPTRRAPGQLREGQRHANGSFRRASLPS
jgi:hypothetical protein